MSTYVREKVLRVPFDKYAKFFKFETNSDNIQRDYPDLWGWGDIGKFQFSPTETCYVDYVLDYEYDCDGEWGKIRELYPSEKERYLPKFLKVFQHININDVRLVEFCWYNGTDAPDYYELMNDTFYQEV